MSKLTQRKTRLLVETSASYRARPLVAEIKAWGVVIREKGRRTGYPVDWEAIFDVGWKKESERQRQAKVKR